MRFFFNQLCLCIAKEKKMILEKRSVTPEKAILILKKYGTIITTEEAKLILDLMYKFGKLAIGQQTNQMELKTKRG
jgi:hypothetical protein